MSKLKEIKLKELVQKLENKFGKEEQIRILQEINEELLTSVIKVGDVEIKPVRVEAYYFHPGKFEDSTVHGAVSQRKFKVLYLHNPKINTENDNGGVDLCLAYTEGDEDLAPYFLSFLIKNSWVKAPGFDNYCKQIVLNKILKDNKVEDGTPVVLEPRVMDSEEDSKIFHTVRKGLSGKPFGREPLASLVGINLKTESSDGSLKSIFDFAAGCGKEQILAEYLWEHQEEISSNLKKWYDSENKPTWLKNIDKLTKKLDS